MRKRSLTGRPVSPVKWTPPTQLDVDAGRQVQRVAVAACARTTGSPAMIAAAGLGDAIAAAGLG